MKEFMAKITRKLQEIFEYKQTRSEQEDGGFMLVITMNLLKNLAARNNIIHQELKHYKDEETVK